MPISDNARSAEAIRRKLRALAAVFLDPAATEHAWSESNIRGRVDGKHVSVGQRSQGDNFFAPCEGRLDRSCLSNWQNYPSGN
jgi:hypothetical protein